MIIVIIELLLILVTAFLVKSARTIKSLGSFIFVLVCGIVLFIFEPSIAVMSGAEVSGGAIQLVAEGFGVYCVIWSIVRMVKRDKKDTSTPPTTKTR
jgi:hypothetical protein